jgi:Two-component response regulator PilR
MDRPRALILDDEPDLRALLEMTLARMGLEVTTAGTLSQARRLLAPHRFDLCFTDMRLPDGNGIELVRELARDHPQTPVAMITAYGNAEAAVEALKAGAFDFVAKPVDLGLLRRLVDDALKLRRPAAGGGDHGGLLGEAPAIRELRAMIERLARSQAPVHITGESGTGKELAARLIHARSPRGERPFVPVNCGAIPAELMESEFFGHLKGSFTGALRDKAGLFQAADGGTLFLDEIAELPMSMQAKLLRALQERAIRPVGAETETAVNVRVISATHQNLAERVADGSFRQDLYYRLNVIELRTPPLREHADDIPLLADAVIRRIAAVNHLPTPPKLSSAALARLRAHPFPGNVRELENVLERAVALCDEQSIAPEHLDLRRPAAAPAVTLRGAVPAATPHAPVTLDSEMADIERRAILAALDRTHWNRTRAAELLGMSFRQLRYRIKKLGLDPADEA